MHTRVIALRRSGFTLIEILIVVSIIAIMALFVIRHFQNSNRQARDATLVDNLQAIRASIEQFQADTGAYPNSLTDLIATPSNIPQTGEDGLGGTGILIPSGSYNGPYLVNPGGIDGTGLPMNPYAGNIDGSITDDLPLNWTYNQGIVYATTPTSGSTVDGIPYQRL